MIGLCPTVDAEKTKRVERLEATLSKLEGTLNTLLQSSASTNPLPQSQPSVTLSRSQPTAATPRPPPHSPPHLVQSDLAAPDVSPFQPSNHPSQPIPAVTPQAPSHAPPPLFPSVTPQPPQDSAPSGKLSSAAINKSALSSLREVVECNSDFLGKESKMGTTAVILAREVYFGEEGWASALPRVMVTNRGCQSKS